MGLKNHFQVVLSKENWFPKSKHSCHSRNLSKSPKNLWIKTMVKLKKKVERSQRMTGCNTYIQEQIFPIPYSFKNMLNLKYPYLSLWLFYQKWQSVQSVNSHVRLFVTTWTAAYQASLSVTRSQSMLKLMSIKSMMPSNHLVLCCPLLLLPSILPSIRVFSNESALCIRWPKYCSFSFSISPSNDYSGLICFRMDWLDFLAVQGTLKSLLQHHSLKASILQPSAFFGVQLSHLHTTAEKTTALTRWTFVSKVMSLLFNMLSRLVITFLPRSKRLLI